MNNISISPGKNNVGAYVNNLNLINLEIDLANQIKDILFPTMEKKEPDSSKRIISNTIESISGNKSKQVLEIKSGIDMDLAKKIVKTIKDSKSKTQANIQGDAVRVSGGKRDMLQECISLVKSKHDDFPLNFGNFRD